MAHMEDQRNKPVAEHTDIPAILPRGRGHQFVCYADSCSGVPGAPEEGAFANVNEVIARLQPQPEFICFTGDEIIGLTNDEEELRSQWQYWHEKELIWLNRQSTPLYHSTGNHTAYDTASERVFREVLAHLPRNGPQGQEGLTYFVRRDDLLLVFVNTLWSGLGGEGHVETTWLDQTLADHADVRFKLVFGHHPVHPVQGRISPCELHITPEDGRQFWSVLVKHQVMAYMCSHLLTFDVQVHEGVLQILSGGAGRAPLALHCVQAALDTEGLRYQALNTDGEIRNWLEWPLSLPPSETWEIFSTMSRALALGGSDVRDAKLVAWRFSGVNSPAGDGDAQTLLSGWDNSTKPSPFWIGLLGRERRLYILISPAPGRSPSYWHGPMLQPGELFEVQIAMHTGMGPGGLLWRRRDGEPWSSMAAASPWGHERLTWPGTWSIGHDQGGVFDRPFRGSNLQVGCHIQQLYLQHNNNGTRDQAHT